jgi:hypothetical protein
MTSLLVFLSGKYHWVSNSFRVADTLVNHLLVLGNGLLSFEKPLFSGDERSSGRPDGTSCLTPQHLSFQSHFVVLGIARTDETGEILIAKDFSHSSFFFLIPGYWNPSIVRF